MPVSREATVAAVIDAARERNHRYLAVYQGTGKVDVVSSGRRLMESLRSPREFCVLDRRAVNASVR